MIDEPVDHDEQALALAEPSTFAGVHLVPVSRYRQVSARLEQLLPSR